MEESQLHNAKMHSKEEEMRQNMEELKAATQKELYHKEQNYIATIRAISSKKRLLSSG